MMQHKLKFYMKPIYINSYNLLYFDLKCTSRYETSKVNRYFITWLLLTLACHFGDTTRNTCDKNSNKKAISKRRSTEHGAWSTEHGARSTEHGARSTRKIEILYEKKYSHFTNLLHILSLLITNFSLLRVRKIGYYPYIRGIIFYTF